MEHTEKEKPVRKLDKVQVVELNLVPELTPNVLRKNIEVKENEV
jgi:hypothetical protein